MNRKKLKVLGTVLAFIFTFLIHFLYDKFPNFITSIFAPVNQSIWEHMKILFGSIILSAVVQKIIVTLKKDKINNICFSNFVGAIASIPIFLIMFLPVYYTIGENFVITIILMFIAIAIAEFISYKVMNRDYFRLENATIFFVIGIYIIFTILTYHPFKNDIFIDPTTSTYGVSD